MSHSGLRIPRLWIILLQTRWCFSSARLHPPWPRPSTTPTQSDPVADQHRVSDWLQRSRHLQEGALFYKGFRRASPRHLPRRPSGAWTSLGNRDPHEGLCGAETLSSICSQRKHLGVPPVTWQITPGSLHLIIHSNARLHGGLHFSQRWINTASQEGPNFSEMIDNDHLQCWTSACRYSIVKIIHIIVIGYIKLM